MAHYRRNKKRSSAMVKANQFFGSFLELKGFVEVFDHTEFEAGMCCNGGHYEFSTRYTFNGRKWIVSHHTSAEFSFCNRCGEFGEHYAYECDENGYMTDDYWICGDYLRIDTNQLVSILRNVEKNNTECWYYPGEKALFYHIKD